MKLKVILPIVIVGVVLTAGVAVWATFSMVSYAFSTANQIVTSPAAQNQIQGLKTQFQATHFQPVSCWYHTQSLLAVQPWVERTVAENLMSLKVECFKAVAQDCEGPQCQSTDQQTPTTNGEQI